MKIEYNEKEIAAMAEFHKGNRAEGLRLQEKRKMKKNGRVLTVPIWSKKGRKQK